jgi:acetylornithine deacetylase/succinyl-diaminopimelate desuccinylase-like protein
MGDPPIAWRDMRIMVSAETEGVPSDGVAELCAALVRIDTTNRAPGDAEGEREAAELVASVLADDVGVEPLVLESAPRRANVVARVPGTAPELPALLVQAHLDVVPADPAGWSVPPFSGEVRDGFVWGRGSVDMKDMCATVLSAVRSWRRRGVSPRRDIVLAFVADEETGGEYGAQWLVDEHPGLFEGCGAGIGEGGGYTLGVDGVRLYPVGAAERGTMHLRLTASGRAGHGSRPNPDNPVVTLVAALARIAAHRWPVRLTPTVREYLVRTGEALGVPVDLGSDAAVDATVARLGRAGALAAAVVRPSTTPTVLSAGSAVNVIPSRAEALVDTRVLPGGTEEVLAVVDELLGPGVRREFVTRGEPVQAPFDSPWFAAMAEALRAEDPEAVVVPYCLGGGTDAKAFSALGIPCYGFGPLGLPDDTGYDHRAMAHGVDERVPVTGLQFGARVLDRFLTQV